MGTTKGASEMTKFRIEGHRRNAMYGDMDYIVVNAKGEQDFPTAEARDKEVDRLNRVCGAGIWYNAIDVIVSE